MLWLMETHPAAAVERAVTAALASFAAPGNRAADPAPAVEWPAAGVPAGDGDGGTSGTGADRGACPKVGRL